MTVAEIMSHPLVLILLSFILGQGVALAAAFWRISTAVRLGSETDEHLKELIEQNTRRIERLEGEHFDGSSDRRKR